MHEAHRWLAQEIPERPSGVRVSLLLCFVQEGFCPSGMARFDCEPGIKQLVRTSVGRSKLYDVSFQVNTDKLWTAYLLALGNRKGVVIAVLLCSSRRVSYQ